MKDINMKTYNDLRTINVSQFVEKKGELSYLSWTFAIDTLLQNDPKATWEFLPYLEINGTIMVRCQVHAFDKTMFMQLAVLDHNNKAIINPGADKVSNSMMRCLVKCIACFGIGIYIYAGEDLPPEPDNKPNSHAPSNMQPSDEEAGKGFQSQGYIIPYGSLKGRSIQSVFEEQGKEKLEKIIILHEERIKTGTPYAGTTIDQMNEFLREAINFIINYENDTEFSQTTFP